MPRWVSRLFVLCIAGALVSVAGLALGDAHEVWVGPRHFVKDGSTWYLAGSGGRTEVHPRRMSVRFHPETHPSLVASFIDSLGLTTRRCGLGDIFYLSLPPETDVIEAYATCRDRSIIVFAEPALKGTFCAIPSDGLWDVDTQWSLMPRWQDFESAWDIETGDTTVIVAVLDSGVNIDHADLRGNLWRNWDEIPGNSVDDDTNGFVDDYWGWNFVDSSSSFPRDQHGSWVTGLICATTNSDTMGVAGPAGGWCPAGWERGDRGNGVRAMTLYVGDGSVTWSDEVALGIEYAIENGASVMNMSFTWDSTPALVESLIGSAYSAGLVTCASVGNMSVT